uniref:hypothetical protein n=1 Tax=Thaumasiovibrio occultus TaxID=1891184 RepID=UPI000B35FF3C|nr:hypothetical protein [Thaumasiovibrio occultus]
MTKDVLALEGNGFIDFSRLRFPLCRSAGDSKAKTNVASIAHPLEVYDERFSSQTLRVSDVKTPMSAHFFHSDGGASDMRWLVALSQHHILYGFRELVEIEVDFRRFESLKPLVEVLYLFGLEGIYAHIMQADIVDIYGWVDPIICETMAEFKAGHVDSSQPVYWLHRLVEHYDLSGRAFDAQLLNVFLMNLCVMQPGEALSINSNTLFMPLRGMCLEAVSDVHELYEFDTEVWLLERECQKERLLFESFHPAVHNFPLIPWDNTACNSYPVKDYCFVEIPGGGRCEHEIMSGQILIVSHGTVWVNRKTQVKAGEAMLFSSPEVLQIHCSSASHYLVALVCEI